MSSEKRKKEESKGKTLNLLDAHRTWFQFDGSAYSVKSAPPSVFDAWIRQYVEEITNVDTAVWEIFHRWDIINACIEDDILCLHKQGDGNQTLEEKASESEVDSEEKASDLPEYEWPELA